MPIVPRGLDEQPPRLLVARLRDRPASLTISGGVLARHQPQVRHQLASRLEAPEVVKLRDQTHRRYRVDAVEAAQPRHRLSIGLAMARRLDRDLDRAQPLLEMLDRPQVVIEHRAVGLMLESEAAKPSPMRIVPGLARVDPPTAQQHLPQSMPRADQILANVVTAAAQIPHRLLFRGRRMHLGQRPRAQHHRELLRIASVRLHSVPGLDRDQRRRHHDAIHVQLSKLALQHVPAGSRLVADPQLSDGLALQPLRHPANGARLVRDLPFHRLVSSRQQHRHLDRVLGGVQPNVRRVTLPHDRPPSYAALAPLALTREMSVAPPPQRDRLRPRYYDRGRSFHMV